MNKRAWVYIYVVVAALAAAAYATTRSYLISTPISNIVVSNLTANYVLVACLTGGIAGWLSWSRLFKNNALLRLVTTFACALLVSILWLTVMSTIGGYKIR